MNLHGDVAERELLCVQRPWCHDQEKRRRRPEFSGSHASPPKMKPQCCVGVREGKGGTRNAGNREPRLTRCDVGRSRRGGFGGRLQERSSIWTLSSGRTRARTAAHGMVN